MNETNIIWIVIGLAVLGLLLAVSVASSRRRARQRSAMLRERFGPEYDRTVQQYGGKAGERALAARLERVEKIHVRELSDAERARFGAAWNEVQVQFVDDPRTAVARANDLIKEVMRARGYSADDPFEQRAADLSVDHPDVVQHYRAARDLAKSRTEPMMDTEQLRQAVVHYRVLFADLLQPSPAQTGPTGTVMLRPARA